uniref:Uncharacterized protein n=1 Tax=Meloidogyne enterolobii TaxID=390850 RepID=A0A6V7XE77_MELEN|nr:unnamed protein product [Meloidogyne enterolobii]
MRKGLWGVVKLEEIYKIYSLNCFMENILLGKKRKLKFENCH